MRLRHIYRQKHGYFQLVMTSWHKQKAGHLKVFSFNGMDNIVKLFVWLFKMIILNLRIVVRHYVAGATTRPSYLSSFLSLG